MALGLDAVLGLSFHPVTHQSSDELGAEVLGSEQQQVLRQPPRLQQSVVQLGAQVQPLEPVQVPPPKSSLVRLLASV